MNDFLNQFKKQMPEKVAKASNVDRVGVTITVSGLIAKAMYNSLGDVSQFVEHCIEYTVEKQGCVFTPDGIVSKKQTKILPDG